MNSTKLDCDRHQLLHELRAAIHEQLSTFGREHYGANKFRIIESPRKFEFIVMPRITSYQLLTHDFAGWKLALCADEADESKFFYELVAALPKDHHRLPMLLSGTCFVYRASQSQAFASGQERGDSLAFLGDDYSVIATTSLSLGELRSALSIAREFGPANGSCIAQSQLIDRG